MARKILLTRLRYAGDVVLTTPCVRRLRESFPDAEIVYLAEAPYGELLKGNPFLSRVISVGFRSLGRLDYLRLLRRLSLDRYDIAIDLLANPRSAILTAATMSRIRVGTDHFPRSWAYTRRVGVRPCVRSAVEHHLEHLRSVGIEAQACEPELFVSRDEAERALRTLRTAGIAEPAKSVILQPGAKWQSKRWPAERFAQLAALIARESLVAVLLEGPGEEGAVQAVQREGRGLPLIGGLSLRELVGVLSVCGAYVGSDGGPAHISAALGKPTVAVFGPSEPDIWFPYRGSRAACVYERIDCRPCHLHECESVKCLTGIDAARVLEALRRVLGKEASPRV
ncbi:MAG: glycosyltransferase family 9 protein [Candidatus Eisenbacteria bacterium]